jgi:hypothetical protein
MTSFITLQKNHGMISNSTPFNFIQDKINNIGSALFYSQQYSVLKFPTTIITALKVDELGQIWFCISRPNQQVGAFDSRFPAQLDFYRKGKGYFLKIFGQAFVVDDPEEINQLTGWAIDIDKVTLNKLLLLKLKIQQVVYFSCSITGDRKLFWWYELKSWILKLFFIERANLSTQYFL